MQGRVLVWVRFVFLANKLGQVKAKIGTAPERSKLPAWGNESVSRMRIQTLTG